MYAAARRTSSQILAASCLHSRLHVSVVNLGSRKRKSSRSHLAQDLQLSPATKIYEKAPPKFKFERAAAPHQDADILKKHQQRFRPRPPQLGAERRGQTQLSWSDRPPRPSRDRSSSVLAAGKKAEIPEGRRNPFRALIGDDQESEFHHPTSPVSFSSALGKNENSAMPKSTPVPPTIFSSPPLLPSFLPALSSMLGDDAKPTPIQALSIKWLIEESSLDLSKCEWKQFLLASETGSGKSLAYLLPLLQKLKIDEKYGTYIPRNNSGLPLNPRAIILAPTHELARQLSSFAKALTHGVKLRVLCTSKANVSSNTESAVTAKKLSERLDDEMGGVDDIGELEIKKDKYPVDILIGTPVKIMELIRGRGWDRLQGELTPDVEGNFPKLRRGRDKMPGIGQWKAGSTLGLENVEWVVIDEADVLFDKDFQEVTRTLLADISTARGKPMQVNTTDPVFSSVNPNTSSSSTEPINYPFNFILTSATIPRDLATYLDQFHPLLVRLTSPRVHSLPKSLKTELVPWTGSNKLADIERRIREIWASDAAAYNLVEGRAQTPLSKILIFCNMSSKVDELAMHLEEKGIKCVALTSTSEQRQRGSNKHLEGFMRPVQINPNPTRPPSEFPTRHKILAVDPQITPHVMVTTSLLSRGLDFSPDLKHVFIVDQPRNTIDFLHRAGRSGRAGHKGKVVVFMKTVGRGSARSQQVKDLLRDLRNPRK